MSEDMQLHWAVGDKKRPLDFAVKLEHLSFNPKPDNGKITGEAWLHINQSGMEFIENIYSGCLELRWPIESDNPFNVLPICRFSIEEITDVSFHRSNDPDRPNAKEANIFITAKVNVIWHLFSTDYKDL